jgi:hypothetical protein
MINITPPPMAREKIFAIAAMMDGAYNSEKTIGWMRSSAQRVQ